MRDLGTPVKSSVGGSLGEGQEVARPPSDSRSRSGEMRSCSYPCFMGQDEKDAA